MIESTDWAPSENDRLSALIERFRVGARICKAPSPDCAGNSKVVPNLFLALGPLPLETLGRDVAASSAGTAGTAGAVAFFPRGAPVAFLRALGRNRPPGLVAAQADIGGEASAVAAALPELVAAPMAADGALKAIADMLLEEVSQPRCGGGAVLDRLCEILVIRLLRHAMRQGDAEMGLLAGLSHPKLRYAVVAMHGEPARAWSLEDLAALAGMSRTQFAKTFREVVGVTPVAYLAGWRLSVAQSELARGASLKGTAGRVGFASSAALSRAFQRHFGYPPRAVIAQARLRPGLRELSAAE